MKQWITAWAAVCIIALSSVFARPETDDPLPSWNPGSAKSALIGFVQRVTDRQGPDYVPPKDRIAVFDNDGTLWPEKPAYFQLLFAIDRVRQLAPDHPEWKSRQPFQAVLENDWNALAKAGEKGLIELVLATHSRMTTDEFDALVRKWIRTARHPRFHRPYPALAYQPMLELLAYLRHNGFKTFIVSGGGIEFLRPWVEQVYGVPAERVVGSTAALRYEVRDGRPVLVRLPRIDFINDKAGKPIGIHRHIGRRPILAFGNSDGDYEMLRYVTSGRGPRLGLILHHTDARREWAYDRESPVGRLDRALAEAPSRRWIVVDMKKDWRTVFRP